MRVNIAKTKQNDIEPGSKYYKRKTGKKYKGEPFICMKLLTRNKRLTVHIGLVSKELTFMQ